MVATLVQAVAAAASIGLGCGTGCGSASSVFLSSYLLTKAGGFLSGLPTVLSFFLGKTLAVLLVLAGASALGQAVIGTDGFAFGVDLNKAMAFAMLLAASYLIARWFVARKKGCQCGRCGRGQVDLGKQGLLPVLLVGFGYGVTPCAPLLLMAGYASALSLSGAVALGVVFSVSSSLVPLALAAVLSGFLSARIGKELGRLLPYFQLAVYVLFLIMALVFLV